MIAQTHSPESVAAAEAIAPLKGTLQRRVLDYIASRGEFGVTDNEGIAALEMNPSTYRPRRVELADAGLIAKNGRRRDGCAVWVKRTAVEPDLFGGCR